MNLTRATLTLLASLSLSLISVAAEPAPPAPSPARPPILGDFAAELRTPDGHFDVRANIDALKAIHANTYFYLIWHKETDWDDLPAFADAAARENINVWVYLIPWSETPAVKKSWGYSEPYRTDYIRWAQEVARLSLKHPNVVGYVIDDFYTNSTQADRFTVPYTRRMIDAGREINPKLKFYPLVYFQQPWAEFMQRFGTLVDGVVAAYPKSRTQVGNALAYLNGDAHGATAIVDYPRTQPSRPGDKGSIYADLRVDDPDDATISFYWDDTDQSNNRGYHQAFVKVDGRTVWQADTAGETADRVVDVNLARFVRGRQNVRVELGVLEERGVSKYPVTVRLDDIRLTGFDTDNQMGSQRLWSRKATGHFTVDLLPSRQEPAQVKLPMILMPAGEGEQYEKRYPDAGTPRNVAAKVRICLDLVRDDRVEGVITYCLPKDGPTFEAVGAEFRRAAEALLSQKDLATTKDPRRPD